ncbi:hypothetical protein FACS189411_17020 [Bacteroidia bacterium]|nr:hypothetical protein FACS189411_17020 [Bacteroidia bacterium]
MRKDDWLLIEDKRNTMKRIVLLLILSGFAGRMSGRQIELYFPALAGQSARIYYFEGNRPDSLSFALDRQGKGNTELPAGYKGFIQLSIPGAGMIECIGGEPLLRIESDEAHISKENVRFPDSKENVFFYRLFEEKSLNIYRQAWIERGGRLYKPGSDVYKSLEKEKEKIRKQASAIESEIAKTDLYASKLLRIIGFADDIQTAANTPEASTAALASYLQKDMDWEALYTAGRFWRYVQEDYLRLFEQIPVVSQKEKEIQYVESVSPLFGQLKEPMRSAFLETVYTICEQIGWETAKNHILSYISDNKIEIDAQSENLKRTLAAGKTMPGKPAPEIKGLPAGQQGITIVMFYESGCDNCITQLEELKKHYARLRNTGIQVISVSADMDPRVFEYHSKSFPWPDKLCDYKGFMGENYINYAIMATPTLYVTGNGIIIGRYASLSETGLLKAD